MSRPRWIGGGLTAGFLVVPLQLWDLDADDGGLVEGGSTGQWAWGTATSGPADDANGRVWGTVLDGVHLNDTTDTLEIPLPSLAGASEPVLVLTHWYEILPGDAAFFEVDDGSGWARVEPVYGYPDDPGFVGDSGGWVQSSVDLAGFGASPRFRLTFEADAAVAADGWYLGDIALYDGDATPPLVAPVDLPTDTQDLDGPYVIRLDIRDDVGVLDADAYVRVDGGIEVVYPLTDEGDGTWSTAIPGQAADSIVTWYAVARDAENETRWPDAGDIGFRVFLAAPTDLEGPDLRVAQWADLTWQAPDSPHDVEGYRIWEQGREPDAVDVVGPSAEVGLVPGGSGLWRVSAVYDVGEGDASDPLALDVEIPELLSVQPDRGYPGDRVYVDVEGRSLYLLQGGTDVDLGAGVVVEGLEIVDVNRARLEVTLTDAAAPGERTLQIAAAQGTWSFPSAFSVLEGGDRPHIDLVEPDGVVQGREARLVVRATEPFAGPISVAVPEGLVVTSAVTVDGATASFEVLAELDAVPGERTVVLDDSARLWPFAFTVREYVAPPDDFCGCSAGGLAAWPWLGLFGAFLLGLRRRRS